MDETTIDVTAADSPSGTSPNGDGALPSSAEQSETSTASATAGDVTAVEGQSVEKEADPLDGLPTQEELDAQAAQNVPYAKALSQLRAAYTASKSELEPLSTWKPLAEKNLDPSLLSDAYEMVTGLHSKVIDPATQQEIPDRYTTVPFLQKLETASPGTTDQLFSDLLTFQVDGPNGPESMVRNLVRSWGLNPDRIDDYRNIDARVPSSGVVSPDELQKIEPKDHAAYKTLPASLRGAWDSIEDDEKAYHLRTAQSAINAQSLEERIEADKKVAQEQAQAKFEQETEHAVRQDISSVVETMHDSIQTRLSSQWKPSSDDVQSEIEYAKVMGSLFSLLDPGLRKATTKALERAGAPLDPKFDGLVQALEAERTNVVRHTRHGDRLQAGQAQSRANMAQNQLLAMLENYAMALAQPSANRLQANSQNLVAQLNGATAARYLPAGAALQPQANANPYELPAGIVPFTEEARAYRAQVDRQMRQ